MLSQHRNLIIEIAVLALFLGGMYYAYTIFSSESPTLSGSNQALLGPNMTLLTKAVSEDRLSFKDFSFMNTELVRQLKDFSQTIEPSATRGRDNPFVPQ